ncbi:heterokaryon incompatibility protein-domain-containing protein, partial [Leptodontidium sp. 2 PMI_412]
PSRVLEVGKEGSHTLRLRVTSGNDGRYAALSHCWGGMVSIRTLRENYRLHQTSIEFSELPATFRDAVIVTRALGIPYLWIDSLCIIQNDTHDWEAESSNMGAVYQNAYLVIGADMSPNSRQGFLDPERDENYAYAIKRFHGDSRQPLALRAWALQEQLLASKMVHFTTKEIIWRCRECLGCECLELDHKYSTDAEHDDVHFQRILSDPGVDRYVIWYRIVDKLMERSITNKLDIFPALSGLAKKMGEHYVGTYLAGLWSNDILRGLLWTIEGKIPSRITPYRAPSWSWASV